MASKRKVLGCSLGNCIHVYGMVDFLRLVEEMGHETVFLGPAVPVRRLVEEIERHNPDVVALSYRLTPDVAEKLLGELKREVEGNPKLRKKTFLFGGTPPVAEVAKKTGMFDFIYSGRETVAEIRAYLNGGEVKTKDVYPQKLVERIGKWSPYPLIRHHYGEPSLEDTVRGAGEIAKAKVLDILSIGTDQNAQENFFRPGEMNHELGGAGGVPVRRPGDLKAIYDATRCGNFPLVRCYAGTRDLIKWADMSVKTINNVWGAIPLCWYSQLDGRSDRPLPDAIRENQKTIRWYGEHNVPVEVNESHQWALRDCSDAMEVATAYLAAHNAKKLGVSDYVQQYMFNTPPLTSPAMDLAKMAAKIELIDGGLTDKTFRTYRMVRTGLASLSADADVAKGQLAFSVQTAMSLKPHIVHVVGYCEGDHAATPGDIIESCKLVSGIVRNSVHLGLPDVMSLPDIRKRRDELVGEADVLIDAIRGISKAKDPLSDPDTITNAIKTGILDTPHHKGNKWARGEIKTKMIEGACRAVHPETGDILTERERLGLLGVLTNS